MNRTRMVSVLGSFVIGLGPAGHGQPAGVDSTKSAVAEVLIVGVYHMSNPGHDIFNMKADDVLAPKRQDEIRQVLAVLERFRPTAIAVEADFADRRTADNYSAYLAGSHELSRNEVEQLGFQLAKRLGHSTVHPVDVDGEFPFQHVVNYAKASGRSGELDAIMADVGTRVKAVDEYLASHTVLETLLFINSDEHVAEDVRFYYRQARLGEPWDWAGADLVSDWFRRNMRIYSNIVPLATSSGDRVLVIYGWGHLGWLRDAVANSPNLRLRKLAEFAR